MDSTADSIIWGKWIALGCLIAGFIVVVLTLRFYSLRRIQRGNNAIPGTAWMVLPRYTTATTDREGLPEVPAPVYNREIGEHDAGYYDKDGNFVAKTGVRSDDISPPAPAQSATERAQQEEIVLQELPQVLEPQPSAPPSFRSQEGVARATSDRPSTREH